MTDLDRASLHFYTGSKSKLYLTQMHFCLRKRAFLIHLADFKPNAIAQASVHLDRLGSHPFLLPEESNLNLRTYSNFKKKSAYI
jgi:hypothetical protein